MLQAVVVIDYQNVHLSAHDLFSVPGRPRHESLIHPLHFAQQLLQCRNQRQRPGMAHAELGRCWSTEACRRPSTTQTHTAGTRPRKLTGNEIGEFR